LLSPMPGKPTLTRNARTLASESEVSPMYSLAQIKDSFIGTTRHLPSGAPFGHFRTAVNVLGDPVGRRRERRRQGRHWLPRPVRQPERAEVALSPEQRQRFQRVLHGHERLLMELVEKRHPRGQGQGLFVRPETGIFRIIEIPGPIFCSDDVKHLIEQNEFSNVSFLEMGEVL